MKIVNGQSVQPDGSIIEIVTVIDEANNKAESMPKAEYDRREAEQVEHLTENPTKESYLATLASESANDSKGNK